MDSEEFRRRYYASWLSFFTRDKLTPLFFLFFCFFVFFAVHSAAYTTEKNPLSPTSQS